MLRPTVIRALCTLGLLAAGAAQAAPIALGGCAVSNLSGSAASDCQGYVRGNDSVTALQGLVGKTWNGLGISGLTQYKDDNVAVGGGSTTSLFDAQQLDDDDDESRGTLTFLQTITGPAVLTLKGGANWAAYFLPKGVTAGTRIGFDIPGVQGAGLSHASIYTAATPTNPTPPTPPKPPASPTPPTPPAAPVPEPAGIALAVLALAAAAAATARARRAQGARRPRA